MKNNLIIFLLIIAFGCSKTSNLEEQSQQAPVQVELKTSNGTILLELSDKTPLHRDNFIKIVKGGWLDSMLFHRVLEGFVVQAGQFDSLKMAGLDSATMELMDYRVAAEIDTSLFHKRGALGAARTNNPERASSSLSFYFVQRGLRVDSLIDVDEKRINEWLKDNYYVNSPENKIWKDSLLALESAENWELFYAVSDTISKLAESLQIDPYVIPEYQREVYRTLGGTPHLDQSYTVFGEVIQGMDVVDSIAAVKVNQGGRPDKNVYILSARLIE